MTAQRDLFREEGAHQGPLEFNDGVSKPHRNLKMPEATINQPQTAAINPAALLDLAAVRDLTRTGKTWIYARMARGQFPQPVRLSTRCSRWRAGDIQRWLEAQK